MGKKIRNDVERLELMDINQLTAFQGNLKELSDVNYAKLKAKIVKLGFSEAIGVWQSDGKNFILNGHQRLKTLTKMRDEDGYDIPQVPVLIIKAENFKQAREKVLSLTSQFGEMTAESLHNFMLDSEIPFDELDSFRFPEINMNTFADQFDEKPEKEEEPDEGESQLIVATYCADESEQEKLFEELKGRGFEVKIIS